MTTCEQAPLNSAEVGAQTMALGKGNARPQQEMSGRAACSAIKGKAAQCRHTQLTETRELLHPSATALWQGGAEPAISRVHLAEIPSSNRNIRKPALPEIPEYQK